MYKPEEIEKMTPKVHPAIKMINRWDIMMHKNEEQKKEYNAIAAKYDEWAYEMSDLIDKKYGAGCGDKFRKWFRIKENYIILSAGFNLDTEKITKIIKETPRVNHKDGFLYEPMMDKLMPIKESVSLLAFAIQTARDAMNEGKNLNNVNKIINANMKPMLTLLAQKDAISDLATFEELSRDCEEKSDKKLSSCDKRLHFMSVLTEKLNEKVYSNLNVVKDYTAIVE